MILEYNTLFIINMKPDLVLEPRTSPVNGLGAGKARGDKNV